jgi:hypothetical protein
MRPMKDQSEAVQNERDPATLTLANFTTAGTYQAFDIGPPDIGTGRAFKERLKRRTMLAIHK